MQTFSSSRYNDATGQPFTLAQADAELRIARYTQQIHTMRAQQLRADLTFSAHAILRKRIAAKLNRLRDTRVARLLAIYNAKAYRGAK